MARGIIRKPSFSKMVGAYRSQLIRALLRLFTFGAYGSKGIGWLTNPKKAFYNFWYNRTSISLHGRNSGVFGFFAMLVVLVALPMDIVTSALKAHKINRSRKQRAAKRASHTAASKQNQSRSLGSNNQNSSVSKKSNSVSKATQNPSSIRTQKNSPKSTVSSVKINSARPQNKESTQTVISTPVITKKHNEEKVSRVDYTSIYQTPITKSEPIVIEDAKPEATDENTPKSIPKHEKDQYIRKRMIIAGSSYCDKEVLAKLSIGTYFDLAAEPDNPYDKDAVMLTLDGEKIGYISKADRLAFVTCLKLKRKMYGVITDIKTDEPTTKYEFETWFDNEK